LQPGTFQWIISAGRKGGVMADPYVGQIICIGFTYAPSGWLMCDGSSYPTGGQYQQLFNVIGNKYGGGGGTFNVPNLQNNITVGVGPNYPVGATGGTAFVALNQSQMAHSHPFMVSGAAGDSNTPSRSVVVSNLGGDGASKINAFAPYDAAKQAALHQHMVGPFGKVTDNVHDNRQPYTAVNFIICYSGNPP
jgi:microcystin-dependent protein